MCIEVMAEGDGYVKMLGTYSRAMYRRVFKNATVLRTKRWDAFNTIVVVVEDRSKYEGFIIKEGLNH